MSYIKFISNLAKVNLTEKPCSVLVFHYQHLLKLVDLQSELNLALYCFWFCIVSYTVFVWLEDR